MKIIKKISVCHGADVYPSDVSYMKQGKLKVIERYRCIRCGEICQVREVEVLIKEGR